MNGIGRREFLRIGGALAGAAALPRAAADDSPPAYDQAYAILYDATRCIGCRACARRCRQVHHLPPASDKRNGVPFDMPRDLSANDLMVLQACEFPPDERGSGPRWSFIKKNCMHCDVPACASACPVAALHKSSTGPVTYDESRCIGCRYCLLACPYEVPRYEWFDRVPRVRKCDLNGACVKACPVRALVDGQRRELIREAHRRIGDSPGRYVDHVYGEHEAGGTSYMVLAGVPLERLGLPKLSATVRSSSADAIMAAIPGWIIGLGLFLGGLYQMEKWQRRGAADDSQTEAEARP